MKRLLVIIAISSLVANVIAQGSSRITPLAGIKLTTPQIASISLGVCVEDSVYGILDDFFIAIEPGIGGGKLHIGIMQLDEWGGGGIKLSILKTWGSPLRTEPDQTYVGIEFFYMPFIPTFTMGVYQHIGGDDNDHDFIVSGGIGLLF